MIKTLIAYSIVGFIMTLSVLRIADVFKIYEIPTVHQIGISAVVSLAVGVAIFYAKIEAEGYK